MSEERNPLTVAFLEALIGIGKVRILLMEMNTLDVHSQNPSQLEGGQDQALSILKHCILEMFRRITGYKGCDEEILAFLYAEAVSFFEEETRRNGQALARLKGEVEVAVREIKPFHHMRHMLN